MKLKVSKERIVMAITIGIACFALMLVMFMQFKVVQQTDITAIETMKDRIGAIKRRTWKNRCRRRRNCDSINRQRWNATFRGCVG